MTPKTIDTIVDAVGTEPTDRTQLAKDLRRLAKIIRDNRANKPPSLRKICTALRKVAEMIAANPEAGCLKAGIDAVVKDALILEPLGERDLSFTDELCGGWLPGLFEKHFGKKAGATRNGPYVKFAGAALEAVGEKIQPETIIRSLTAYRKVFGDDAWY